MAYLIKISENASSASPALTARSAIRFYNLVHRPDLPSPTDAANVSMLMKGIERKFSSPVKKRLGTSPDILRKFIDLLCFDQLKHCLFKQPLDLWFLVAKTIVKFHCFARFEEVVALKWNNIKFLDDGNVEITFTKGKNNQFHHAHTSVITKCINSLVHCPVNILKKFYLVLGSPDKTSFFLPKLTNGKPIFYEQVSYPFCVKQFKAGLQKIGVNPAGYGEHSDRTGALSTAAFNGCSPSELQIQGRWKSDQTPKLYLKKSVEQRGRVSGVLNHAKSVPR